MTNTTLQVDAAHGGHDWQPRDPNFQNELGTIWANCGANSECGKLKKILLHRPGAELSQILHPSTIHWNAIPNLALAQKQHDALANIYAQHGVEIIYLESEAMQPNHLFMRDLLTATPQGIVLSRMAATTRTGEELAVYQTLAKQRIPVIQMITEGCFEGPDLIFIDPKIAFVATSIRSSAAGAHQVKQSLLQQGIQVIDIQTTYGCGHLDGVLNIIDKRKVVLYPTRVSYTAFTILKNLGYTIIELPNRYEAEELMAINMVALEPGLVLIPKGCTETIACLKKHHIEAIPVDISELMKGGGAIHCMTGVIWREFI